MRFFEKVKQFFFGVVGVINGHLPLGVPMSDIYYVLAKAKLVIDGNQVTKIYLIPHNWHTVICHPQPGMKPYFHLLEKTKDIKDSKKVLMIAPECFLNQKRPAIGFFAEYRVQNPNSVIGPLLIEAQKTETIFEIKRENHSNIVVGLSPNN